MSANLKEVDLSAFNKFENNEAYLQSWIEAIHDKPDALIRAVKEATRATDYMEYKAGITPESEYNRSKELDKTLTSTTSETRNILNNPEGKSHEFLPKTEEVYHPEIVKPAPDSSGIRLRF